MTKNVCNFNKFRKGNVRAYLFKRIKNLLS